MIDCGGGGGGLLVQVEKHHYEKMYLSKCLKKPPSPCWNVMCLIYLFLAGLRTSLFSLETASVLSHSNLKIEMSLLGCIAVMAATSFGLFNCAVNTYRCEIFLLCLLIY